MRGRGGSASGTSLEAKSVLVARAFFHAATKLSDEDEDILPQEDGDENKLSVYYLFSELFPEHVVAKVLPLATRGHLRQRLRCRSRTPRRERVSPVSRQLSHTIECSFTRQPTVLMFATVRVCLIESQHILRLECGKKLTRVALEARCCREENPQPRG